MTLSLQSVAALLVGGMLWGCAFSSSHVNEFTVIRAQLSMSSIIMLKTFLAALTFSTLSFLVVSLSSHPRRQQQLEQLRSSLSRRDGRGLLFTVVGAALLGAGLSLCASCPGTVYSQLGAGSITAWAILSGGLCGAAAYSGLSSQLAGWQSMYAFGQPAWLQSSLDQSLSMSSRTVSAFFFLLLLAVDVLLELAVPTDVDASSLLSKHERQFPTTVMPLLAGAVLGLQQLTLCLFTERTLGSSGSYAALLDVVRDLLASNGADKTSARVSSQLSQLLLPIGVVMGSFAWVQYTGYTYKSNHAVSLLEGLIGGAVMVLGARMAGGCTSGHGVTGCSLLSLRSFLATTVMFMAAITCEMTRRGLIA